MPFPRFQTLIFDLDDTLIPTSEVLIPPAVERSFKVLQKYNHPWSYQEFDLYRKKHMGMRSHRQIFRLLVEDFKTLTPADQKRMLKEMEDEFYSLKSLGPLSLIEGAQQNLEILSRGYKLILLTAGEEATQKLKIRKADIFNYFHLIQVADHQWNWSKKAILEDWSQKKVIDPSTTLSIGNRLSEEIEATKRVGGWTCFFRCGEHASEEPQNEWQKPDFQIHRHEELISQCQL